MKKHKMISKSLLSFLIFMGLLVSGLTPPVNAATSVKKLVFILDASGSMWGKVGGKTKIEIAREVLTGIIADLPDTAEVGLVAYGHRSKGDCNDVEDLVPLGKVNKKKLISTLKALNPKGKTPISRSVKMAVEKLKSVEDEVAILLVSDGKETCEGDPCGLVKKLKESGVNFKMHVVGFDVSAEEKAQLDCMAQSGGGLYFTANTAGEFKKAFQEIAGGGAIGKGPGKLEIPKMTFKSGEKVVVSFTAQPDYAKSAWVGIVPAKVAHGDESINDRFDLTYQYLQKRTSGTMTFTVPQSRGSYDFRMFNTDSGGVETAAVSFNVEGKLGKGTLTINKKVYEPGETISVNFTAESHFKKNAWIGIIPSSVPHGKERDGDANDLAYKYISGKLKGSMTFNAPGKLGSFDMRMYDTDSGGDEMASVTFKVAGEMKKVSLRCEPTVVKPGAAIRVHFTAPATLPKNAWVGLIPSNVPHGDEATNDANDMAYKYLSGRVSGVMEFRAPAKPGSYDFRLNESDSGGKELVSVTFTVK
jgi:von Willebrand factor type A domain